MSVLVELRAAPAGAVEAARRIAGAVPDCQLDESYEPVPMEGGAVIVRCLVNGPEGVERLKRQPGVIAVWTDAPIAPM
jgi:hypothetical protein